MKLLRPLITILTLLPFVVTNAQIQPPAGIGNNIILWLSPDTAVYKNSTTPAVIGDRVREWHDISGGGYIFTTPANNTRPRYRTYQGKRVLDFINGDLLENTGIASIINGLSEFSIYVVIKSDDVNTDQGFLDSENPDGADEIICMRYDRSGANTGRTNLIKCGMQGNTPNNQIESQSNTQTNRTQVLTLTWKTGEKINLFIDGVLNESSNNTLNSNMSGVQKILLGKGPKDTGGNRGWDGRIGTVVFYNKKMNQDTVALISGDLKSITSVQSGNWNDPNTWDCNCNPPNNAFVRINNTHVVSLTQNETADNLIIQSGGSLDLTNNNYRLSLKRNFTNNGTLISHQGRIRLNGTDEQLINGTSSTDFYDLTLNNNQGARMVNGSANIAGTLDIRAGCLTTNNSVTLLSNALGTARLAELSGSACVTGNITMQRYVDAGATDWRFITSPISGATLAELNDDFVTSGFPGSQYPNWPTAANPWPSIYSYDETQPGSQDSGFVAATNITNPMGAGAGFWVYSGDTIIGTQPFTIDFTGPPNVGDINLPVSYTNTGNPTGDGWSMVGNPYPSTIDWDSPNITKTNINNAIYIWNPDLQQFASYIFGIGTNGGSRNIASSQAFWVQGNAAGAAIQVTEACKTATDGAFLRQNSVAPLRITAQNNAGTDEIAINFEMNASNGFDPLFDAEKMTSVNTNLPSVSSVINGTDYSINQLAPQEIDIPIKVLTGVSGLHTIRVENVDLFNDVACLMLEDLFTNTMYDLELVNSFNVYIFDTTKTARFLLHVGAPEDIDITDASCYDVNDAKAVYTKHSSSTFDITWTDASNAVIAAKTNVLVSDSITNLTDGTYYVETTDALCGNSIDTVVVAAPDQITSHFTVDQDTVFLNNGATVSFNNESVNATNYLWDFNDGNLSSVNSPVHTFVEEGKYLVNLTAGIGDNCSENFSRLITVMGEPEVIGQVKAWINNNTLTVDLANNIFDNIQVTNLLGQVVFETTPVANKNTFNLEHLSSQILLVSVIKDEQLTSFKVNYTKD